MADEVPTAVLDVIADFEAEQDNECSVRAGQLVVAVQPEKDADRNDGWMTVSLANARDLRAGAGYAPVTHLQPARPHGVMKADFVSETEGEMSVPGGAPVWLVDDFKLDAAPGWVFVYTAAAEHGFVPETFVELVDYEELAPSTADFGGSKAVRGAPDTASRGLSPTGRRPSSSVPSAAVASGHRPSFGAMPGSPERMAAQEVCPSHLFTTATTATCMRLVTCRPLPPSRALTHDPGGGRGGLFASGSRCQGG